MYYVIYQDQGNYEVSHHMELGEAVSFMGDKVNEAGIEEMTLVKETPTKFFVEIT